MQQGLHKEVQTFRLPMGLCNLPLISAKRAATGLPTYHVSPTIAVALAESSRDIQSHYPSNLVARPYATKQKAAFRRLQVRVIMSDNKEMKTTSSFASRLLNKELADRKKTTQSLLKLSPADAAKFAVESEHKETVSTK